MKSDENQKKLLDSYAAKEKNLHKSYKQQLHDLEIGQEEKEEGSCLPAARRTQRQQNDREVSRLPRRVALAPGV